MRTIFFGFTLLAACRADDADLDGFSEQDDCDDADPFVYPGAPDTAGDGLDADCDGSDPVPAYVGGWELTDLTASYSGIQFLLPDRSSGVLTVTEAEEVTLDVDTTLDPVIIGAELDVALGMLGDASAIPGTDGVAVYAEGEAFGELMHVAWDCALDDADALACAGELKALELSLDAAATFTRL